MTTQADEDPGNGGHEAKASARAPPDVHDFAHRGGAPGDARVERAQAELEAAAVELLELRDQRVEAAAALVDLDDVARADALGRRAPRRRGGRRDREQGRLERPPWRANAMWRPGRTPRRGGAGRRSPRGRCARRRSWCARRPARAAARRGTSRRRPRAPSRSRRARRRGRSRARAASRCARRTPSPSRAAGRKWKMPPPSLSISTITSFRPSREAASRPPMSWASATSPISSTTGPRPAAATPNAVETVPSIPFAPRLDSTRNGVSRAGKNVSTSRIGIEEATTSVASAGSTRAELGGHARLVQPGRPDRRGDRARGGAVGGVPVVEPARVLALARQLARRAPRASPAGRRRRSSPTAPAGSCQAPSGSKATCSASSPASQVRSGFEVGRSPTRRTRSGACAAAHSGVAQQRVVVRDRRRAAARARERLGQQRRRRRARRTRRAPRPAAGRAPRGRRRPAPSGAPQLVLQPFEQRAARASRSVRGRVTHGRPPSRPGHDLDVRHAVARRAPAARAARSSGAPGPGGRRPPSRTRGRRAGAASARAPASAGWSSTSKYHLAALP